MSTVANHRIHGKVQVGRDLRDHLVQPLVVNVSQRLWHAAGSSSKETGSSLSHTYTYMYVCVCIK